MGLEGGRRGAAPAIDGISNVVSQLVLEWDAARYNAEINFVDEARPYCRRCRTAGIPCTGYPSTTFISFEAGSTGLQRLDHEPLAPQNLRDRFGSRTPSPVKLNKPFVSWPPDDLCIAYARAHLPRAWNEDSCWRIKYPDDSSANPTIDDNLVQYTLISLARTLFACRFRQNDLLQEGSALYRQVLSTVNGMLGHPDCVSRLDLLESIIALRAYDVGQSGYQVSVKHACEKQADIV